MCLFHTQNLEAELQAASVWTSLLGVVSYVQGGSQNLELSAGGQVPGSTGFPCEVSVLGTHLCQCTSWHCCERLRLASVEFF